MVYPILRSRGRNLASSRRLFPLARGATGSNPPSRNELRTELCRILLQARRRRRAYGCALLPIPWDGRSYRSKSHATMRTTSLRRSRQDSIRPGPLDTSLPSPISFPRIFSDFSVPITSGPLEAPCGDTLAASEDLFARRIERRLAL